MDIKFNGLKNIIQNIISAKQNGQKLLAILLDPDKIDLRNLQSIYEKVRQSPATHIFVGGSTVSNNILDDLIVAVKQNCSLPIILFPGDSSQISAFADGILFLNLISGRNPKYLIEQQIDAVPLLQKTNLEVIPTAYILIESGSETTVGRVSKTQPMQIENPKYISQTAQAGEFMGNQLVYLEAGSGATNTVPMEIISEVFQNIKIPLIVGGGIRSEQQINDAYDAGADLVVIGTAFENDQNFFERFKNDT